MNKREEKKIPKINIKKNVERLFVEYEEKKKRMNENIMKKEKEMRNKSSNRSSSKASNQIVFKRFKKILENAIKTILDKNLDEKFEVNFSNFTKLLYKINFTTKNYFEVLEQKPDNEKEEKILQSIKSNSSKVIFKKNKLELDREYKLIIDAWKIITKNKEFKSDISGTSERTIIFFLSALGIYDGNINNSFIQKEFSFLISEVKDNKYSNLSKQIYKYFAIFKNNAINGLLFRERDNKRKIEIEKESDRLLTFCPNLEKSSQKYILASNSVNHMRLSVEKNYNQFKKNKELKLKEKEKLLKEEEKAKCPFCPSGAKNGEKKNIEEISKRLFNTGLKHLKLSNSTNNNKILFREQMYNSYTENPHKVNNSYKKMFNNNPLESDFDVKKKVLEMEESRNKKAIEKLILKKGFKPKDNKYRNSLYDETGNKSERFALEDEPLNTFKNTFERYEKFDKRSSNIPNKEKFEFEIVVERKPRKLILYQDDDINCKVKDFCNLYKLNYDDKRRIIKVINHQMNNSMNDRIKF